MKKFKIPIIIGLVLIILVVVNLRFDLIDRIIVQFSSEKYAEYVSEMDYEEALLKEPVCIKDMASEDRELTETELDKIIKPYDFHTQLNEKYNLSDIATADSDFDKAVQILEWLTKHTYYSGMQMKMLNDDTLEILEYSFDKPFNRAINCRYRAIAFADCLVAVGIKAFPVAMVSSEFTGSHFTCLVYISEEDKWCSFDPSFGCWFTDEEGELLDIFEIRELFLENKEPVVKGYSFNGKQENFDVYMNSFLKFCVSNLSTWADNSTDRRSENTFSGRKQFSSAIPEIKNISQ
ncbi:MAG: transglutaminase domain-containing protein [Ruminococcaceae bacterium]|nr:transglutaminase domain-containing protein [Oscillospiraceae bacterium]